MAQVDVAGRRRRPPRARRRGRRRRAASRRCSCRRRPSGRRPGPARTCRRRSRPRSGRRASARITQATCDDRLAASTSRGGAARRRAPAAPPSGGRGSAPSPPRSRARSVGRDRDERRVGDAGGVLVEVGGLVPAGHARAVLRSGGPALIGRSRRGSGRASPASRSGRRCRRRGTIGAVAWRLTKLGSRMCTRAGFEEPSERTKQPSSPRGLSIG